MAVTLVGVGAPASHIGTHSGGAPPAPFAVPLPAGIADGDLVLSFLAYGSWSGPSFAFVSFGPTLMPDFYDQPGNRVYQTASVGNDGLFLLCYLHRYDSATWSSPGSLTYAFSATSGATGSHVFDGLTVAYRNVLHPADTPPFYSGFPTPQRPGFGTPPAYGLKTTFDNPSTQLTNPGGGDFPASVVVAAAYGRAAAPTVAADAGFTTIAIGGDPSRGSAFRVMHRIVTPSISASQTPSFASTGYLSTGAAYLLAADVPEPIPGGGWRVGAIHMGGNQGW